MLVVSSLWLAGSEQSAWWAKENTGGAKDLKTFKTSRLSRQPPSFSDLRRWLLYSTLSELLVLWSGRLFILGLRLSDHVKPLNPNSAVAFRGGDPHHTHHFSDSQDLHKHYHKPLNIMNSKNSLLKPENQALEIQKILYGTSIGGSPTETIKIAPPKTNNSNLKMNKQSSTTITIYKPSTFWMPCRGV